MSKPTRDEILIALARLAFAADRDPVGCASILGRLDAEELDRALKHAFSILSQSDVEYESMEANPARKK